MIVADTFVAKIRLSFTCTGWQGRLHHINDGANAEMLHEKSKGGRFLQTFQEVKGGKLR